jgi:ectoine hydroxylase-related dioxygenase (phytanoyl-CoA dioxygenase family)
VIKGSHKSVEKPPQDSDLPSSAHPVCVSPGSALLFDRRMIHSIRSPNQSDLTRKAIFIQYAYRWMCPADAMTVEHLQGRCDAVRSQLLGLMPEHNVIDGAARRSSRYHPTRRDIPLAGKQAPITRRVAGAVRRKLARLRM